MTDITKTIARAIADHLERPYLNKNMVVNRISDSNASEAAQAALTAIKDAGYVIVPRELSPEMLRAGEKSHGAIVHENGDYEIDIPAIWTAITASQGEE